jgi:hypothetical protein
MQYAPSQHPHDSAAAAGKAPGILATALAFAKD